MEIRGKYIIVAIAVVALSLATFAWTFQYLRGRRVLELWGSEAALLIRVEADRVELLVLEDVPADDARDETRLDIDGAERIVARRIDLTGTPGILHARQALIEDASFNWSRQRDACQPRWPFALQFTQGERTATVAIDTHCQLARLVELGREASIAPIAAGMETFLAEKVRDESNGPAEDGTQ